jgi:hypothetical protein
VTDGARLAIHGHFYQPDRRDPFTGRVPIEPTAAPYPDWNARITDECYAPNAEVGNFERIGWDIGPALATWLQRERPAVHDRIRASDDGHNGMAQAYHHSILPLASARDRRTEIRWGLRDFELRFGRRPTGLWLPETAVDLLTLRICAEEGVRYTILAPWQAATERVETRRPYRVEVGGREILVLFFDGLQSAAVSFDPEATRDADAFARERLTPGFEEPLDGDGADRVTLIATDGEFYGHHQAFRDMFLQRLTTRAPVPGLTTVGRLLDGEDGHLAPMGVRDRTSWSCHHGVARWSAECPDARNGAWKSPLRAALDRLAGGIDALTEEQGKRLRLDPWAARDAWVDVASEFESEEAWLPQVLAGAGVRDGSETRSGLTALMAAQASRLSMFASDGWFWDDPARIETYQILRFAAHAARTMDALAGSDLEAELVQDLCALRSPQTGQDGAELLRVALAKVEEPVPVGQS